MSSSGRADVLVLGSGPAALAAAAHLGEEGISVRLLAPDPEAPWPAEYAAWQGELPPFGDGGPFSHSWPSVLVGLGGSEEVVLDRGYGRIDKAALAEHLRARCARSGVTLTAAVASGVRHHPASSTLSTSAGEMSAALVVDATGHDPVLVRRPPHPPRAAQTAFGLTLELDGPSPFAPDRAVLMDWDDAHLGPDADHLPPSFLYAQPLGEGRLFVEETSLVARPPLPLPELERRLRLRLQALGVRGREMAVERCVIPMGGALPDPGQRVVGFGGAAGMVHPATGYLLPRVLTGAPSLARAVAGALGADGSLPSEAARAGWQALWPADRLRRYALFRYGMEAMLTMDAPGTRAFFRAFFSLPESEWSAYLGDGGSTPRLLRTMLSAYRSAAPGVRGALRAPLTAGEGAQIARSFLPGGR